LTAGVGGVERGGFICSKPKAAGFRTAEPWTAMKTKQQYYNWQHIAGQNQPTRARPSLPIHWARFQFFPSRPFASFWSDEEPIDSLPFDEVSTNSGRMLLYFSEWAGDASGNDPGKQSWRLCRIARNTLGSPRATPLLLGGERDWQRGGMISFRGGSAMLRSAYRRSGFFVAVPVPLALANTRAVVIACPNTKIRSDGTLCPPNPKPRAARSELWNV